jgi:hypothetical protein
MGVTWAVGWGLVGFTIELIHNIWPNPIGGMVDIWPAVLAYPAFFGGLVFSTVLGIAGRRRRFDQLSLPGVAAWGALGGLFLGVFPATLVALGAIGVAEAAVVVGAVTVLGAVSAAGSLMLARVGEDRALSDVGDEVAAVGLTPEEARRLLGGRD